MIKKLFAILFCITLSCFGYGFSDIKQQEEYTCAPVCAANCIIDILNQKIEPNSLVQELCKNAKTDNQGTTAQNLITAIEKYLAKKHLQTQIKYYGIRRTAKQYQAKKPLNICEELQNGRFIILNIGFYEHSNGVLKRKDGHYVNACSCKNNRILITDPYAKDKSPFYIELHKPSNLNIKNTKDNEKYNNKNYEYYKIKPDFDYQTANETALLNGIISIYPLYL